MLGCPCGFLGGSGRLLFCCLSGRFRSCRCLLFGCLCGRFRSRSSFLLSGLRSGFRFCSSLFVSRSLGFFLCLSGRFGGCCLRSCFSFFPSLFLGLFLRPHCRLLGFFLCLACGFCGGCLRFFFGLCRSSRGLSFRLCCRHLFLLPRFLGRFLGLSPCLCCGFCRSGNCCRFGPSGLYSGTSFFFSLSCCLGLRRRRCLRLGSSGSNGRLSFRPGLHFGFFCALLSFLLRFPHGFLSNLLGLFGPLLCLESSLLRLALRIEFRLFQAHLRLHLGLLSAHLRLLLGLLRCLSSEAY
mmetsp:Transcript_21805/g.66193  ORF Transcript_21805/g.66193 Transcript_21805/m.66193 type:complete len:295 (-) Transcript_21805:1554-2438(-)